MTNHYQPWKRVIWRYCGAAWLAFLLAGSPTGGWWDGMGPSHVIAADRDKQAGETDSGTPKSKPKKPKLADQTPGAPTPDGAAKDEPRKNSEAAATEDAANPMLENPFPRRQMAPSLDGGVAWINTDRPLELRELRGKFVVLDFWTYCCINCMHVLPVLKQLERAYPDNVVVIGVHSAKFDGEQDSKNITDAVMRYEIEHPIINDAEHVLWNKYFSQSWPSLRIIDPEGYLVAVHSGEIGFEDLDRFFKQALPYYRQQGLLDERPLRFKTAAESAEPTPLRFPGKILADEASGRLFVADSNHNRIVVASLEGKLIDLIGDGSIGARDGDFGEASFDHPQGMALVGETLYVADTENHLLRKVDLRAKTVTTIAGVGKQGRGWPGMEQLVGPTATPPDRWVGPPLKTALNSPWALVSHDKALYIAMAGPHQIWKMPLDESEIGPYAGNGREDIVDGRLLPREPYQLGFCSFAQPSGLSSDGATLYVADSEGSSIRAVPFDPKKQVRTIVGTADLSSGRLFTFGDVDGDRRQSRLQHCLDVLYHDRQLFVADTYNNKIKVVDPATGVTKTLVGNKESGNTDQPPKFDEPAGLAYAAGRLYVADTNNHSIRTVDLARNNRVSTLVIQRLKPPAKSNAPLPHRPRFDHARQVAVPKARLNVADGHVTVRVALQLPDGYKINAEAPQRYYIDATMKSHGAARDGVAKHSPSAQDANSDQERVGERPVAATGLGESDRLERSGVVNPPAADFDVALPVATETGAATIKFAMAYYYCEDSDSGLCKTGEVVWTVPIEWSTEEGEEAVALALAVD